MSQNKKTVPIIMERKNSSKKIVALTAYDYSFSRLLDLTDLDIILVGDSLSMVSLGYNSTLPVTMELRNVVNGFPGPKILPFARAVKLPADINISDNLKSIRDRSYHIYKKTLLLFILIATMPINPYP